MDTLIDALMLLVILADLALLGSNEIAFCIKIAAVQGIALGFLPFLTSTTGGMSHVILLAVSALVLKGVVFPNLLFKALRAADIRRETRPFVSCTLSLLAGVAALAILFWMSLEIVIPTPVPSALILPVALFTSITGLFIIIARKTALTQVLGYLLLENGIYIFGAGIAVQQPWIVEMGVLLDVFVAVFIMGIMIFHISREFDHIDTHKLSYLRDWKQRRGNPGAPKPEESAAGESGR